MKFDFYINKIHFLFKTFGTGNVTILWNGDIVDHSTPLQEIDSFNDVKIIFQKKDPADQDSYALLEKVSINDYDFTDMFKTLKYNIDSKKHKVQQDEIPNNLYFGYEGEMNFSIQHINTLLAKAAWTLADKEFQYIKIPTKNDNFIRAEKNRDVVITDARDCFFGFSNINDAEMIKFVDNQHIGDLKTPLAKQDSKLNLQNWINESKRINFSNFDAIPNFCFSDGIIESINSFLGRADKLYIPTKVFYIYRSILGERNVTLMDIFNDELIEGSKVLLELPSPWYPTDLILDTIDKAKKKNCTVALDLTWLPVSNDTIDLDLRSVDEIYFGMNKTWPLTSFRPGFRWSRKKIEDVVSFKWEHLQYSVTSANIFMRLVENYGIDYIYDKYVLLVDKISSKFKMERTPVLWFGKKNDIKHKDKNYISPYFFHDELIGMKLLIKHQGKYFW